MFDGKTILITGGTGSLGTALTSRLLETEVDTIRIFSRNESSQIQHKQKFENHERLRRVSDDDDRIRYFIGDVRDYPRLVRAMESVDIVFHAAALKHVPIVEYNPFEAVKTNVLGTQNVIDACIHENIEIAVGITTDKAVSPLNAYGATKLLLEKLFVTANNYLDPKKHKTKFISLRYGNVFGSSNSVIPLLINQIKNKKKITITDPNMTRFSITMNDALDFILQSAIEGKGSEIFIPQIRSYIVSDLRDVLLDLFGNVREEIISLRPGEKMHETLINKDEMRYAWELNGKYILFSSNYDENLIAKSHSGIKKFNSVEHYSSDNCERISKLELKQLIIDSGFIKDD
jgi:UDP-N-acetylglucosamine 4,6-dehydratase/UDP-glucose 4-epimerase|tara:strand:+ start:6613 stop:7650 length:1038 start_codon:yes stop_codon:yes gene_type:complete